MNWLPLNICMLLLNSAASFLFVHVENFIFTVYQANNGTVLDRATGNAYDLDILKKIVMKSWHQTNLIKVVLFSVVSIRKKTFKVCKYIDFNWLSVLCDCVLINSMLA